MKPVSFILCGTMLCGGPEPTLWRAPAQLTPAEQAQKLQRRLEVRQLVEEGNTPFALALYRQLQNTSGNLFFSPYSLSTTLAMTYAGARGETEKQMAQALKFSLPQAKLHVIFAEVQRSLNQAQTNRQMELRVANSLWPRQDRSLRIDYRRLIETRYQAVFTALDYGRTEEARQTINRWVEDRTRNKIRNLIPVGMLDPGTELVLANAIYFKGAWANPFDSKLTRNEPFHVTATKTVAIPMMTQRKMKCGYSEDAEVQVLAMAYRGGQFSLMAILPKRVDGLADLEKGLTVAKLRAWTTDPGGREVNVSFPRFKVTSGFRLDESLKALGMVDAFSGRADFSGMFERRGPFIGAVVHMAFVEVNEEGTEAAAATGVMMTSSAPPTFRANHPFLFLIRDQGTGSVLFLGRVVNPAG